MIKGYPGSLYGSYRQLKFADVYTSANDFLKDYEEVGIPTVLSDSSITILYYLLYGLYGNSVISASDINRFKYRLFSIVWQHGPTWEKRLEIQARLRSLTEEDILIGAKQIYNHATHPATEPGTYSGDELDYIDDQNVNKYHKSLLEGYAQLYTLLVDDVTGKFLNKFKKLFLQIVQPEEPLYYISEVNDNDN